MSIKPIGSISFSYTGRISRKHQKIIHELIALGIQPSYNYEIDKAKLCSAKSKKVEKTSQKEELKEENKVAIKNKNTESLQYNRNDLEKETDYKFLGALYVANINKFFKIKNTY